ncbi:efflux RND transporter periplasmic adaptor subunit [Methylobacterium sp. ID0610]|uniref:efflux RND transporter periplasmic adaptor subunit n=1 Tax=Methylobacterium carpenticola TaxID=3344827 RepID=UPI003684B10C
MRAWLRAGLVVLGLGAAGTGLWVWSGRPLPGGALLPERVRAALPDSLARWAGVPAPASRAEGKPAFAVRPATAETERVPIAFSYTGVIVSNNDAALQPRVTGVVVERPFEPGGHVKAGQVLFRIDPRPFEVALRTAEAQRAQARAQLSFAEAEVQRTEPLAEKGFASEQRFQQLESNRAVAESRVQEAEAAIARQKLNLEFAVIRAPFDGRSSLSDVNVGDLVTENTTQLVSVVQVDPIEVQVALSAEDSEAVRTALSKGRASLSVLDGQTARRAEIDRLDNRFDPRTARRLVRARLANADERYLPGEFVRTRVEIGDAETLLVPTVALSAQLDQRIVWALREDGTVAMTPVETGEPFGERTAILKGLKPGTRIAASHIELLRQGQRVGIRRDEPERQAASETGTVAR